MSSNLIDEFGGRAITTELLSTVPDEDYLSAPLIRAGTAHSLTAKGGDGKSLLALEIALGVALGRPHLGNGAFPGESVLYLDYEMTPAKLKRRLDRMDVDTGARSALWRTFHYHCDLSKAPSLHTPEGGDLLMEFVDRYAPRLVIIDTLSKAVLGDESSNTVFSHFARYSLAPLANSGVASLLLDHTGHGKTNRARGAAAKRDNVDVNYVLKCKSNNLTVRVDKDREGDGEDSRVVLKAARVDEPYLRHEVANASGLTPKQEERLAFFHDFAEEHGREPTNTEVLRVLGGSRRDIGPARAAYQEMAA